MYKHKNNNEFQKLYLHKIIFCKQEGKISENTIF
jgi:hypothetical protein